MKIFIALVLTISILCIVNGKEAIKRKSGFGKKNEATKSHLNGIWSRIGKRSQQWAEEVEGKEKDFDADEKSAELLQSYLKLLNQLKDGTDENELNFSSQIEYDENLFN